MTHLPYIPLNKREDFKIEKSDRVPIRDVSNRTSCDILRRYPNGRLDVEYAAQKVIDCIVQLKDVNQGGPSGWPLTPPEKALLSILLPGMLMPFDVASTMLRISPMERGLIAAHVQKWLGEMANWSAGFGGGGRGVTIDKAHKESPGLERLEELVGRDLDDDDEEGESRQHKKKVKKSLLFKIRELEKACGKRSAMSSEEMDLKKKQEDSREGE